MSESVNPTPFDEYEGASASDSSVNPEEGALPTAEGEEERTDTSQAEGAEEASDEQSDESVIGDDPLAEAMATIARLEEEVARRKADVYNVNQEYSNYVRRSKQDASQAREAGIASVIEALLPVLDDVALAREHEDLDGPAGQIALKLENTLTVNYHVERFGAVGDLFDPHVHEALMHQTSPEAEEETVNVVIQPGYRIGEKVVRPARVGVVSPE